MGPRCPPPPPAPRPRPPPPLLLGGGGGFTENSREGGLPGEWGGGQGCAQGIWGGGGEGAPRPHLPRKRAPFSAKTPSSLSWQTGPGTSHKLNAHSTAHAKEEGNHRQLASGIGNCPTNYSQEFPEELQGPSSRTYPSGNSLLRTCSPQTRNDLINDLGPIRTRNPPPPFQVRGRGSGSEGGGSGPRGRCSWDGPEAPLKVLKLQGSRAPEVHWRVFNRVFLEIGGVQGSVPQSLSGAFGAFGVRAVSDKCPERVRKERPVLRGHSQDAFRMQHFCLQLEASCLQLSFFCLQLRLGAFLLKV